MKPNRRRDNHESITTILYGKKEVMLLLMKSSINNLLLSKIQSSELNITICAACSKRLLIPSFFFISHNGDEVGRQI